MSNLQGETSVRVPTVSRDHGRTIAMFGRRELLSLGSATLAAFLMPFRRLAMAGTPVEERNKRRLYNDFAAAGAAREIVATGLQWPPLILQLSRSADPSKPQDAGARPITEPSGPSAEDLTRLATLLNDGNKSFLGDSTDSVNKYAALGLQTAGAATAMVAPELAIVLSILGIWAEPTLKYLEAQPNLLPQIPIFPNTAPELQRSVLEFSLAQLLDTADSDPSLKAKLDSALAAPLGVSSQIAEDTVVSRLPAAAQAIAANALQGSNQADDPQFESSIDGSVASQVKALADKMESYSAALTNQADAASRNLQAQRDKAEYEKISNDVEGAIQVSSFIIDRVFGDKAEATRILAVGAAIKKIADATVAYLADDIGTFGYAGILVAVADTLINAFVDHPPDPVLVAIAQVEKSLNDIKRELASIEQRELEIITSLVQIYSAIQTNAAEARRQIATVNSKMDIIIATIDGNSRSSARINLKASIDRARFLLAQQRRNAAWNSSFGLTLTEIYTYSDAVCCADFFAGDPQGDLSATVDSLIAQNRSDYFLNSAPLFCSLFNVPFQSQYELDPDGRIGNPLAWVQGASAYLQLLLAGDKDSLTGSEAQLKGLWRRGMRIREAMQILTSKRTLTAARSEYEKYSGINDSSLDTSASALGIISRGIDAFLSAQIPPEYTLEEAKIPSNGGVWYSETRPFPPPRRTFDVKWYRATNDPYDVALANKLIIEVDSGNNFPPSGHGFKIQVNVGPNKGNEPFPGKILMIWKPDDVINIENRSWDWKNRGGQSVRELLDFCADLIRDYIVVPKIKQNLPAAIEQMINLQRTTSSLSAFERVGVVGRCCANWASWLTGNEWVDQNRLADVRNVPGIFTADDLAISVKAVILSFPDHVERTFSWKDSAVSEMRLGLQHSSESITAHMSDDTSRGLATCDSVLKQLAAYMSIRGVAYRIPSRPVNT